MDTPKAPAQQKFWNTQSGVKAPAPVEIFNGQGGNHDEEVRENSECLTRLEALKAPVKGIGETARGVAEVPIPVEAPRLPDEQMDEEVQSDDHFPASVEFTKVLEQNDKSVPCVTERPFVENGQNLRGATKSFATVEALSEKQGKASPGSNTAAAPVKAPDHTSEENCAKAPDAFEVTAPVEAPKAVGGLNGQKPSGGARPLAAVEAPRNGEKSRGGAKVPTRVEVPRKNSVYKEVDNGKNTNKDPNLSSLWTSCEMNVSWEIVEQQGVLGPGPSDYEKAGEHKHTSKEFHTYFVIKIPKFSENKWKTERSLSELRFKEVAEKRDFINAATQLKKANRMEALHKLRSVREKVRACADAIRRKKEEISPLQGALRKLRDTGRQERDKSRDLPASEQELDKRIGYCEYKIQHESIPLKEEKQLLREIKNLRASRHVVCAKEALHAEFSESQGERENIQERLKPLVSELESLKAEWTIAARKTNAAEGELEEMDSALSQVQEQWTAANQARQDAYIEREALIRQENAENNEYYQNKREMHHVRQLAFKKEKKAVDELCYAQVERVMSLWNNNAEFRAAYVKSNERSTLKRLQTFDGRALGPDEEPPLLSCDSDDSLSTTRMEVRSSPNPAKPHREASAVPSHSLVLPTLGMQREDNDLESRILERNDYRSSINARVGSEEVFDGKEEEDLVVAANLKQKRREQEMAKARDAEERKRRSAQRLQSKASARAQREADRQQKEKEKKSQKKAARLFCSSQRIMPSTEGGCGGLQETEPSLDVQQELLPTSGPISRYPKRPPSLLWKLINTLLVSSLTKKVCIHLPAWFWTVGLVGLFVTFAVLAIFLL